MKNTIRVERAIKNITQAELAEKTGVSRQTIQLWRGQGILPNSRTVSRTLVLTLRADLRRVMNAPRRTGGVDGSALRELIDASAI